MTEPTSLPDDPELLKPLIRELFEQLRKGKRREESLQAKVDELARKLFGRKTEQLDPNQLTLIDLAALGIEPEPEAEPPAEEPVPEAKTRRRPKRRRPSRELPRRRVEHSLPETERQCPCCDEVMPAIREEIHEQLDYHPASFEVIENVTFVYGCRRGCDEKIVQSTKPPQMIEKGIPGPGLLAHVMVSKYCDHVPLYRLAGIFKRHRVDIAEATLGGWVKGVSEGIEPLVQHLKDAYLLRSFCVATDDTSVPVQKKGGTYRGRLWTYLGDADYPVVVYDYTPTRERAGPEDFLKDFGGYLQADAYSGYDQLFDSERDPRIVEVGCWMHARRYFYEASQKDKGLPMEALALIRELYRFEKIAKDFDPEKRLDLRLEKSAPVLDAFENWIDQHRLAVLPKSLLGKALTYASNQWQALRRFTEDGRLEIDNGRSERELRRVAIGRKNWLFAGNDAGGRRAANIYSLIGTCRVHGWDPFAYLRWLFVSLPGLPHERLDEVTPMAWAAEHDLASKAH
ncbi:MAG: IS66 family transposase [Thermoanaerobaculia bacterium]|nr:IS66 family transposase [Thermoanaerobaculia bacterium]